MLTYFANRRLEAMKRNQELLGEELARLHNILITHKRGDFFLDFTKGEILIRITIIEEHMLTVSKLTVSKLIAGLEY